MNETGVRVQGIGVRDARPEAGGWGLEASDPRARIAGKGFPPRYGLQPTAYSLPRGVTLIELLIVITIMLMITAAAIPIVVPATQNRQMREAARLASSYFSAARSRAIETGRPVGVLIQRANGGNFALTLSTIEVQEPYAGDTGGSTMMVTTDGQHLKFLSTDSSLLGQITTTSAQAQQSAGTAIRQGDMIRFNNRGALYQFNSRNPSFTSLTLANQAFWYLTRADGLQTFVIGGGAEPWTDSNGNGYWDSGEPFTDVNGNYQWDGTNPAETYTDTNNNGLYDPGEPFNDVNNNNQYDYSEPYVDQNGNNRYDAGEQFQDLDGNGAWTPRYLPFQIFRQPMASSVNSLTLPEGVVIDVYQSGIGLNGLYPTSSVNVAPQGSPAVYQELVPFDPVIVFSPGGSIVYTNTWQLDPTSDFAMHKVHWIVSMARPTAPIYLLLGRRDLMRDLSANIPNNPMAPNYFAGLDENTFDPNDPNVSPAPTSNKKPTNAYLQNYWISIGPQTGLVNVSEAAKNPPSPPASPTMQIAPSISYSRAYAHQAQSTGVQ